MMKSCGVPEGDATRESESHGDKEVGTIVVNKEIKNEYEVVLFNKIDKMNNSKRQEDKEYKLGLSWAKLSSNCVKLIRSYDMLSCLNRFD